MPWAHPEKCILMQIPTRVRLMRQLETLASIALVRDSQQRHRNMVTALGSPSRFPRVHAPGAQLWVLLPPCR